MGMMRIHAAFCVALSASACAVAGLYQGEWWTDRDYGYSYGYDFYDYYGDYGYVGPGAHLWDAEWFPLRSYNYKNWGALARWFGNATYLDYVEAVALGAKTAATKLPVPGRQVNVKAEVVETAAVPVGALKREHFLVLLKTQEGELFQADLGPALPGLRESGIRKGRQLGLVGTYHRVRGRPLVLADSVKLDGVTLVIREPPTFRVTGLVLQMAGLDVAESDEVHRAVLLETEQGLLAVIIGPRQLADALGIEKGGRLLAEGRVQRFGEYPYAVAYRLQVIPDKKTG